jgi:transcriptional regulatory protein LevR
LIFNARLEILRTGNVISPEVEELVRRVISRLEEHWHLTLTEERGGRMVTHLAMALMRIMKLEEIKEPESDIMDEFRDLDVFPKANEIVDDLVAWAPMNLPKAEKKYMIVNICLLLDGSNDGK